MRWRVYLFCALAWFFLIPPSLAHAEKTLQERYLEIYIKIHDADQYEQQGDYRSALATFQECYAKLQAMHQSNPDWEPAMVNARLNDFKVKIADLKPKADAQVTAPAVQPTPSPSPSPTALPDDPIVLKQQLTAVQQELITAKQQISTTNQQLDDMTAKFNNSQTELQALHSQLDAVNLQLANQKSQAPMDDQMGKLLAENKDLTDKLAAAQKQLDLVKSPKSLALLQAQLKNEKDKLAAAEAQNTGLQQATTTLKQQLDQAQADLAASKQQLASTPTTSPDYAALKHENEIMRDILTNELHEQAHRDMAKRLAQEEFDNLKIKSSVLQQQLDILASPMTPASNDEEKDLLASLKTSGPEIPGGGNVLSTQVSATPTPTPSATVADNSTVPTPTPSPSNNAPAMADTTPTPTPDNSANQPSVTVVSNNPTPTPQPVDPTPTPNAPTTTAANDTAPTITKTPADSTTGTPSPAPAITSPTTSTPDNGSANTTAITPPVVPDTTTPPAPDNTRTVTHIPEGTTTYTDTTIKNSNSAPQSADPSLYANKPVLPDDMKDTAQQAADLFKAGRYDDASAKYQSIIDKYPESIYAWSNLGVVRFQQGHLPEALKALQQAVKISPSDAFSYRSLGIVYYQMSQYDNAIGALERAIALDPNNVWSHDYLGCACAQKGWQEVAEKEFRKAIDIDETFGEAHFNLAVVYADSKPPALALASRHYNRALELGVAKDPHLEKLLKNP